MFGRWDVVVPELKEEHNVDAAEVAGQVLLELELVCQDAADEVGQIT